MPDLRATPASVAFGNVSVGSTTSIDVALTPVSTEEGVSVFGVLFVGAGGPFSLAESLDDTDLDENTPPYGDSTLIDAGTSRTITVNFKPTATGAFSAVVRIMFNGIGMPASLDIPITGAGV